MTWITSDGKHLAVKGVCPRGCGSTLFLGEGGYVTCSWHACPEPDAAASMLARSADHMEILNHVERMLGELETSLRSLVYST